MQVSAFMEAPRRYSVSPFYSFVTVTTPAVRSPSFAETLTILWRWLRGDRPSLRQTFAEERLIEKLADEMGDEPKVGSWRRVANRHQKKSTGLLKTRLGPSSSASAPKAILCYKGKCENITVSYECGNVTQGNSLAYANGLVIDNGVFENKYRKMNPLDWICIQITEDGCDANFWGPKSSFCPTEFKLTHYPFSGAPSRFPRLSLATAPATGGSCVRRTGEFHFSSECSEPGGHAERMAGEAQKVKVSLRRHHPPRPLLPRRPLDQ